MHAHSLQMYQPDWNERLLMELQYEASLVDMKLLSQTSRWVIWKVCSWFGHDKHGVPGMTCELLERYLYVAMADSTNGTRITSIEMLKKEVPPLIAACMMLASKMNNASKPIITKSMPSVFASHKTICTLKSILASEVKIYKNLHFRVPLWTNVEKGQMLAMELGHAPSDMCKIAWWVNFAEYKRPNVSLKLFPPSTPSEPRRIVLTLHLIAGAVAAAMKLRPIPLGLMSRLAALTNSNMEYLVRIRDAVIAEAVALKKLRVVPPKKLSGNMK